jgi:enoyl-CoA hydratase/carnithine racemase
METIHYRTEGSVGYLTLHRPNKYNAVNYRMLDELEQFWRERRYDSSIAVIVLDGGESRGFCAGIDMNELYPVLVAKDTAGIYNDQCRLARLLLAMRQAPQPIICAVHGAAAGLGFSFVMASDIRVIAPDARFCAAYLNIGLGGADMGSSYFLPRLIGSGRANEFLLTGNWMSAEEAMQLGFASRLVSRERLLETTRSIAETMITKNPMGLRVTKEALNVSVDASGLEAALAMEDRNQTLLIIDKKTKEKA